MLSPACHTHMHMSAGFVFSLRGRKCEMYVGEGGIRCRMRLVARMRPLTYTRSPGKNNRLSSVSGGEKHRDSDERSMMERRKD